MPSTAWPYHPNQILLSEVNDVDHYVSCGACCTAAILRRHGIAATAEQELRYVRGRFGESGVQQGQMPGALESFLEVNGMAFSRWQGWDVGRIDDAMHNGRELIFLIDADSYLRPKASGPNGHYIASCQRGVYYNPWGGNVVRYDDANVAPATTLCIEVAGVYLEAHTGGMEALLMLVEDICQTLFKGDVNNAIRWLIRTRYREILQRQVETPEVMEEWVRAVRKEGIDFLESYIMNSDEGEKVTAHKRKSEGL